MPKTTNPVSHYTNLHTRRDRSVWRVWCEDWPGDVFEVLELDQDDDDD